MDTDNTTTEIRYPQITVTLTDHNGNANAIISTVRVALRQGLRHLPLGQRGRIIDEFTREATSGDHDHVITTCMRWVTTN